MIKSINQVLAFSFLISPTGTITSKFGDIDDTHKTPHTGIDFSVPEGNSLYAPIDGVVDRITDYGDKSIGTGLIVKTEDGYRYILGHLSEVKVKTGEIIQKGDLIALSGNSGHSTGAHVHFGVLDKLGNFVDPSVLFKGVAMKFSMLTNKTVDTFMDIDIVNDLFQLLQSSPSLV